MRRTGAVLILYAFMLSYFGVGSIRNAVSAPFPPGAPSLAALLFGACWVSLAAAAVLLLLRKRQGITVARVGAAGTGLIQLAGGLLFQTARAMNVSLLLFTFSLPVSGLFLAAMLPRFSGEAGPGKRMSLPSSLALPGSGAILPWIAGVAVTGSTDLPLHEVSLFIGLFMSLWCLLPFVVLLLLCSTWTPHEQRSAVLAGGAVGTAGASLYTYGLIWLQQGNSFILALLPPVVFAGQAAGILCGLLLFRVRKKQ